MRIYRKKTKTNIIKLFIQRLILNILVLIGGLYCLNWVVEGAKALDFTKTTKTVIEIDRNDDVVSAGSFDTEGGIASTDNVDSAWEGEALSAEPSPISLIKANAGEIDWKVLYGIYMKESSGDCSRVGDKHLPKPSYGCYQWSLYHHPDLDIECAKDLACSTRMTAERLARYARVGGIDYAIRKHNGGTDNPATLQYLKDVQKIIQSL